MTDLTAAPAPLRSLYEWLHDNGFTTVEDVPGGTLHQLVVVARSDVLVSIRADRGDWDLTVSLDAGRTFWQVDQLEAYLNGTPWIGEPSSNEHRANFIRARLDELRTRWREGGDVCEELYRLGDEWMSWRFGLPIPDGGFPGRKTS